HLQLDDRVDVLAALGEQLVERARLAQVAREAVEDEALGRVVLGEAIAHHRDGDAVGHQLTRIDVPLRLEPDRRLRPGLEVGAEQVPARDVRDVQTLRETHRLGALARAWWTDQEKTHATPTSCTRR